MAATPIDNTSRPVESFQPVDLPDYERLAPARMSTMDWEYLMGGAADERTLRRNREGYQKLRLRPNVLVDVSKVDTRTTLLGQEMPFPILLAPAADHKRVHPEGEFATMKGAGMTGATWVINATVTTSVEDIGRAATSPWWFQLHGQKDRGFTRELVRRAQTAGCRALVLTVNSPVPGLREMHHHVARLPGMERAPGDSSRGEAQNLPVAWKEIDWLRDLTSMPILLKGIVNPDDATHAVDLGVQGMIVSNYGAHTVEPVPATIDALPGIVDRAGGRIPVLIDGGIRRGTDVLKALGLGAAAVLIGRPYLQGLALDGAAGVAHVIRILRRELEMAMASTGRPTIASIDGSVIWR